MGLKHIYIIFLGVFFIGCTTSRWIANPEPTLDFSNSSELDSEPHLSISINPTPDSPVIELTVLNHRLLDVPMVYTSRRVIQRYRPKYGFLIAGGVIAAGTYYLAENLGDQASKSQKNLLRVTASGVLVGSLLNMKPTGSPIETGESHQYGQASITKYVDSTTVYKKPVTVIMNAALNGESLVTGREFVVMGQQKINLVDELGLSNRELSDNSQIYIQLVSQHEILDINLPVSSIMKQYIRIARRNASVRTRPELSEDNLITTVAPNSYLPLTATIDTGWYRTNLGASTAYVNVDDAILVWKVSSGFNSDFIVNTQGGQRGTVDIERDIPVSSITNTNAVALIVSQESYPDSIHSIKNAHRSGDLVTEYFVQTLGIPEQNVIRLKSPNFTTSLREILNNEPMNSVLDFENRELFIYYAGAGSHVIDSTGVSFSLLSSNGSEGMDLNELLSRVSSLSTSSNVIIFESDFSNHTNNSNSEIIGQAIHSRIDDFLKSNSNSAIFLASESSQRVFNYQSSDLRTDRVHGIFTYYFLKALQNGNTALPQIRDILLRNVTFSSRRLHNRAQDPIIKFNANFSLRPVE